MSTSKKSTPPPLSLPERPPSKVEAGLKGEQAELTFAEKDAVLKAEALAEHNSPEALRERAIEAMVAAGLSREFAEASFVLADENPSPAVVAEAVAEVSAEPLCEYGCHGESWADVRADLEAVSCEHGSFARKPHSDK